MVAAAIEKPFLIRVLKPISSPSKGVTKDDFGVHGYDFQNFLSLQSASLDRDRDRDRDRGSPCSGSAWFLLEPTDSGLKISQVFAGVPQEKSMSLARKPASSIIGSTLYEIGGMWPSYIHEDNEPLRKVRSLDVHNPSAGWKVCSGFTFDFKGNRAAAFKNFIYLFGPILDESDWSIHFGYVYDTIKQHGYKIHAPTECSSYPHTLVWAPLEGRGMLVSFQGDNGRFFLHDPYKKEWSVVENYDPLPLPLPIRCRAPIRCLTSFLNGILYIFDLIGFKFFAYDCNKGKLHYSVEEIPKLCINSVDEYGDDLCYFPEQLIAISDSRFYLMGTSMGYLFVALLSISFDNVKATHSAKVVRVQCFLKDTILTVYNCVAVDTSPGRIAKSPAAPLNKKRKKPSPKSQQEVSRVLGEKRARLKCSQENIKRFSTRRIFPLSKRMIYKPLAKKVTQRMMVRRSRRQKLIPKNMNPPSGSTHQFLDDDIRIIHIPMKMKLGRHQEGNNFSEGQG